MNRHRFPWRELVAVAALVALLPTVAPAQTADTKAETIRPEVATPLLAAEELIKAKKYPEALAKVREADAVADRTPFENYIIDRTRSVAAAGAGDMPTTVKALEAVVASGRAPPADQLRAAQALALTYFRMADYPKAATWAARYVKDGGTDPQIPLLRAKALYLADDFAAAATELRAMVDADEKAATPPTLEKLQLLASSYIKQNNNAGYVLVLDKLLVYYPKKEYWADAIGRVESRPGFPEYLLLDALRLREATGNLTSAPQYTAMAQLALKAGFPAEAKRVVEQGFASGVLGTGADAELQRKLRDTAAKQVVEDDRMLAQNARDAGAAKDGGALLSVGYAMVTAGQFDKGVALMEQGIQKGGINRPDEAQLHLAIAYLAAGQKAKAVATFRTVQGSDGTADLARLWLIHAQRSSS